MEVELAAAEALLDRGVSVPFKELRIPFTGRTWQPRVTMRRPRLGGQIRIARIRLGMKTTADELEEFTPEQSDEFMVRHGGRLSRMIALTVCRGWLSGIVFAPLVAFIIRWRVDERFILAAHDTYISLLGAKSFSPIIRSAEILNPMKPMLSHKKRGS